MLTHTPIHPEYQGGGEASHHRRSASPDSIIKDASPLRPNETLDCPWTSPGRRSVTCARSETESKRSCRPDIVPSGYCTSPTLSAANGVQSCKYGELKGVVEDPWPVPAVKRRVSAAKGNRKIKGVERIAKQFTNLSFEVLN
jgi:hypothetical protein